MPIVGPTFDAELDAAGIAERRFSRPGPGVDGDLQFHPDVSEDVQQKILAVLKAHDGPLSEARHQALTVTDTEAARRIAEMFGKPPDSFKLAWKEINALGRAVQLLNRKIDGTALPEERLELEALDGTYNRIQAIRDAEGKATAALLGAKSVEEVQKVTPGWPKG